MLDRHFRVIDESRARFRAGNRTLISSAMMPMTTSNSTRVNARRNVIRNMAVFPKPVSRPEFGLADPSLIDRADAFSLDELHIDDDLLFVPPLGIEDRVQSNSNPSSVVADDVGLRRNQKLDQLTGFACGYEAVVLGHAQARLGNGAHAPDRPGDRTVHQGGQRVLLEQVNGEAVARLHGVLP